MTERIHTVDEAAAILRMSPYTLKDWLRAGKIKGFKLGGKQWRIKDSALQKFIKQREQQAK